MYYYGTEYDLKYKSILKNRVLHPHDITQGIIDGSSCVVETIGVVTEKCARNIPVREIIIDNHDATRFKTRKEAIYTVQMIKKITIRDKLEIYNIQIKKCEGSE
jgi:hypothetical protein